MSNETEKQVENILASLNDASIISTTDEQNEPRRFLDIHVYNRPPTEGEEPEAEDGEHADAPDPEHDQEHTRAEDTHRRPSLVLPLLVIVCSLVLTRVLVAVDVLPLLAPSATITMVPVSVPVHTTSTLTVGSTGAQVPGRALATFMMSQARTIPTTGQGHQDTRAAHGFITFYNAALSIQVVPAGTVLATAYGVQIMTEQDATIPAGSLATNGHTSVPAHALLTGPGGNLDAGAIYGPCCRTNVFAASSAFSGGQTARDYAMVRQADIDETAQTLIAGLLQSTTQVMQGQVHPDETLLIPLACTSRTTTDHHVGEEAAQVSVTVDETCSGHTYQTQALHETATRLLSQAATKQRGSHYGLTGTIETTITKTTITQQKTVALEITSAGTWVYQFSEDEVQRLKATVAGKSQEQARTLLLHMTGVQQAAISLSHGETMPMDTNKIAVTWLNYQADGSEKGTSDHA